VTHALVAATGLAPPDGLSYPYQLMVVLISLLTICLGFRYLRKFLLAHCSELVTAFVLLGIGLGTNLFYYVVEKPAMTHGYLFTGYAAFLWFFHRHLTEPERQTRWLVVCGFIAGMLCLTRSSEIVVFALPALYGLRDWVSFKINFRRTVIIFGLALSVFTLQLAFYRVGTGQWFQDGYKGLGFDWLRPHLYEGFFGYRRGWLVYTPLMALALLGIGWLRRGWLFPIFVFTVANCYLLFSWHIWWYGNTFGSRPVVQSYAVLALPLGALLAWFLGTFDRLSGTGAAGAMKGTKEQRSRSSDASFGLAQPVRQARSTGSGTTQGPPPESSSDVSANAAVTNTGRSEDSPTGSAGLHSLPKRSEDLENPSRSSDVSFGLTQSDKSSSDVSAVSASEVSADSASALRTIPLTLLFAAFIALNLFQHWQYNQRIIPLDFTNKTYYWHVFGKTTLDKKDRVYLDTNEKLPAGNHPTTPLLTIDTLIAVPPKAVREFTNLLEYRVPDGLHAGEHWVRATTHFSYHGDSFDKWKFTSIVTEHRRGDATLKWVQVNLARTVDTPAADSLRFDLSLPELQAGDVVKQYVWNLSQDSLALTNYRGELLEVQ
ncbi:MAG: hypothetical protein AAF597_02560, partial [Bacteroidota bacterium]